MVICNCEIISCHGLQSSEVSTMIPIVKAQAVTSYQCQKWWLKKPKKGCLQPFAGLIAPALPPQKPTQASDSGTGSLFAPLRHLRTSVTSDLQPNIWDWVLLISVSLPFKYLFTPSTLPEESFHHWPLISAASPGGGCLMFSFLASLGSFLGSHMTKGLHKHLFSLGRRMKSSISVLCFWNHRICFHQHNTIQEQWNWWGKCRNTCLECAFCTLFNTISTFLLAAHINSVKLAVGLIAILTSYDTVITSIFQPPKKKF